jgi:Na+/H+ antiporter NhaD/arsenite permease-like protein
LSDAHSAYRGGYQARQAAAAAVPRRARDQRKHRQCGHAGRESAKHDHWTFLAHLVSGIFAVSPACGACSAAINFFILRFGFRKMLRRTAIDRADHLAPKLEQGLFALVCVVLVSIFAGFLAGLNLAWTAMAGAALVMVLARRDTHGVLKLVDWHLLLFFAALFIVVDGLSDTGLPDAIYSRLQPIFGSSAPAQAWNLTWFSVVGSNVFSNVPFVLVAGNWIARFAEPTLMWKVLALATTFAGNLTIIGSVANMIVVESARDHIQVGFWDYARFGIPVTILTTGAGVVVLLVLR